jgi:hypothetical protein
MTVVVLVNPHNLGIRLYYFLADDLKAIIEHLNPEDVALVGFQWVVAKSRF